MYDCKILADSVSPTTGHRLTTFEISYPYIIHAEIMTHRVFSRNTQSSRATPVMKNVERVQKDPFIPPSFRKNQRGMKDGDVMEGHHLEMARDEWRYAMEDAVEHAQILAGLDTHKALANRVLGPYQWFRMILTATDFENYFALRCHPEAQAEIRTIAEMMKGQYDSHQPQELPEGWWHLPLVHPEEFPGYVIPPDRTPTVDWGYWKKVSIGRCARVSYLTHDGRRDLNADVALYERLLENGHMSPFEHVARPFTRDEWEVVDDLKYDLMHAAHTRRASNVFRAQLARQIEYAGNLHGWWSARMDIPHQHNYALHQS